jgi:hypothetical protein
LQSALQNIGEGIEQSTIDHSQLSPFNEIYRSFDSQPSSSCSKTSISEQAEAIEFGHCDLNPRIQSKKLNQSIQATSFGFDSSDDGLIFC